MVIQNGSRPDERHWLGTVGEIAPRVLAERDEGPGIIVLGATVSQHPEFIASVLQQSPRQSPVGLGITSPRQSPKGLGMATE